MPTNGGIRDDVARDRKMTWHETGKPAPIGYAPDSKSETEHMVDGAVPASDIEPVSVLQSRPKIRFCLLDGFR